MNNKREFLTSKQTQFAFDLKVAKIERQLRQDIRDTQLDILEQSKQSLLRKASLSASIYEAVHS